MTRPDGPSFRELHDGETPLLLPNAWDVASALGFVAAGFSAIGTTSFGVAAAAGTPDGGRSTKESNRAIARLLVHLPAFISLDIEDGYSDDPDEVAEYVASLGVAGINIEDSTDEKLIDATRHGAKVAAIKQRSPELFVNARIDTFWLGEDANLKQTLERATVYTDAGADGIFVPGATAPDDLRALSAAIALPLNVLVVPGLSLADLGALGIRRVSTGSLPYRAAIDAAVEIAVSLRERRPLPSATPYPEMQERLVRYQRRVLGS